MQISPEQGEFLSIVTRTVNPSLAIEVGTFTGYSALAIGGALGSDASLICCDVSEEWTAIAREHWEAAGIAHKIDLRIGPADETLQALRGESTVDFAFIDADKAGYVVYYELLLPMLSERGVICVDNTLWGGSVLDDGDQSIDTEAIRRFNAHVAADSRTTQVIVPIGDGLTMIQHAH